MKEFALVTSTLVLSLLSGCSGDSPARTTSGSMGGAGGASTVSGGGAGTSASTATTSTGGTGGAGGSAGSGTGGSGTAGGSGASAGGAGGTAGGAGQSGAGGGGGTSAIDGGSDSGGPACTPGTGTVDVGTKSILDRKTCLVWEKASTGSMTNKQAAKYCDELVQDGISDWRVPAPEELATWPNLAANSNAYITNPIYIPTTSASDQEGCTANSHSCNLTEYNAGSLACAWQGVAFSGPAVCVRGTAQPGTTVTAVSATMCAACSTHVMGATADFKLANCLPFAN
jgi:Protein of unknown function (DUF1566)